MSPQILAVPRLTCAEDKPAIVGAPSCWTIAWNTVRRLVKGPLAAPPPNAARDSALLDACVAIRAGRADKAWAVLARHAGVLANDPTSLNLLGVCCELRRDWQLARRFYGVAISINPRLAPAQQNMRRLYELYTFGRSRQAVALGDTELRQGRTTSESRI